MEVFVLAVLIGFIPAAIARSKGRSFVGWWFSDQLGTVGLGNVLNDLRGFFEQKVVVRVHSLL